MRIHLFMGRVNTFFLSYSQIKYSTILFESSETLESADRLAEPFLVGGEGGSSGGGKGIFPVLIAIICYLSVTKGRWREREKSRMEVEEKGNGGKPPFLSSSAVLSPSLTSPPPPFSSLPLPPFFASFDFLFPGLHSAWKRGREREWVGRYYRPRYVVVVGLHWLAGWLGRRKSTFFSFSRSVTVSPSEEKASPSLPPLSPG